MTLLNRGQSNVEHKGRVKRDAATGAVAAVRQVRRNDQAALASDLHSLHALIPPSDDLTRTEHEGKWCARLGNLGTLSISVARIGTAKARR